MEKVANRFTLILFFWGVCSILFALIWTIPNPWEASQVNQGIKQRSILLFYHPQYWIRYGFHYASLFLSLSVATSFASLFVYFRLDKLKGIILCLATLALALFLSFIIFYKGEIPLKIW